MPFKVTHEKDICIGCGACAAIDPADWIMNGDKADLLESAKEPDKEVYSKTVAEVGLNRDAESACPVKCIHVKDL